MPLARDQKRISRHQRIDGAKNCLGPVGNLVRVGAGLQDSGADQGGVFGARVVVGDIKKIGMFAGSFAHQRAFGAVTVATSAKDHDDPPHDMRTQRPKCGLDGVWGMGIIHIDRRAIAPGRGKLHPAPHPGQAGQDGQHRLGRIPCGDGEASSHSDILGLKGTDQGQPGLERPALPKIAHLLPRRIRAGCSDLKISPLPLAHGQDAKATGQRHFRHVRAARAVKVDHRHPVIGQKTGEKPGFGGEIGRHRAVVIKVILRQVGEARRRQPHPVKPPLVKPVGRGFHRGMGDPALRGGGQKLLQGDRIRSRMAGRGGPRALDPRGADIDRFMPKGRPDLAGKGGHAGLAIGAGHRDHCVGLRPEPQGGGTGQCSAGVFRHHKRSVTVAQHVGGQLCTIRVSQDRGGPLLQCCRDECGAMDSASGQGGKKHPRTHRTAVGGKARQGRIAL